MAPETFVSHVRNEENKLDCNPRLTFIGITATRKLAGVIVDSGHRVFGIVAPNSDPADNTVFSSNGESQIKSFRESENGVICGLERTIEIPRSDQVVGDGEIDVIEIENYFGPYLLNGELLHILFTGHTH